MTSGKYARTYEVPGIFWRMLVAFSAILGMLARASFFRCLRFA